MLRNGGIEIVDNDDIKKIRGYTEDNTYVEIRCKDGYLDIRASNDEGGSMRRLYSKKVKHEVTIEEMYKELSEFLEKGE